MPRPLIAFVALSLTLAGCAPSDDGTGVEAIDFEGTAAVLLQRLDLQAGERVLLVGIPGRFDALVPHMRRGIEAAGAVDLGAWSESGETPDAWSTDFTASLAAAGDGLMDLLRTVDAAVMLPGPTESATTVSGGISP